MTRGRNTLLLLRPGAKHHKNHPSPSLPVPLLHLRCLFYCNLRLVGRAGSIWRARSDHSNPGERSVQFLNAWTQDRRDPTECVLYYYYFFMLLFFCVWNKQRSTVDFADSVVLLTPLSLSVDVSVTEDFHRHLGNTAHVALILRLIFVYSRFCYKSLVRCVYRQQTMPRFPLM